MPTSFKTFSELDFNVFSIQGLEPRMTAIQNLIQPKFQQLADEIAPFLSNSTGDEMIPHIAKHARRTVNPPEDTWVAFANNRRGYKKLPHFQIGLWETHVFVWFAVIYESPIKVSFSNRLNEQIDDLYKHIPDHFSWSVDHTKPTVIHHGDMNKSQLQKMIERLGTIKKSELLCGVTLPKNDVITLSSEQFIKKCEAVFQVLMPLYKVAKTCESLVESPFSY
ncbi:DUF1054 family protein [Terrilactibacillus sp. BCM23-1]|uniref:UPF0637 protein GMB86_08160 n=1 Tax=Terrilactibacillus tamarindi TaxID=2599694 RepID=A0A6N8CSE8_9BACI|nr:DUF1054 domain-containing protein [Terrilactibacillus tamarindi]MTT31983.1 DUF1054 family protein [Terrilactibacillus tamarindi]